MMQRLCCEKMAITNRDKKYSENSCNVLEEKKGSKDAIEEWRTSGVDDDYITR